MAAILAVGLYLLDHIAIKGQQTHLGSLYVSVADGTAGRAVGGVFGLELGWVQLQTGIQYLLPLCTQLRGSVFGFEGLLLRQKNSAVQPAIKIKQSAAAFQLVDPVGNLCYIRSLLTDEEQYMISGVKLDRAGKFL